MKKENEESKGMNKLLEWIDSLNENELESFLNLSKEIKIEDK